MTLRIPGAAKALCVLAAVGLLLSGCHYYRPAYGGLHVAPPGHNYKHHYGKDRKHWGGHRYGYSHGDRHGPRHYRRHDRGWR